MVTVIVCLCTLGIEVCMQFPEAYLSCDSDVTISSLRSMMMTEDNEACAALCSLYCRGLLSVFRPQTEAPLLVQDLPARLNGRLDIDLIAQEQRLSFYAI